MSKYERFLDAVKKNDVETVKVLLQDKRVDPSADDNWAIRWASVKGHSEVLKLLLQDPRVDPSTWDNYAIRWASVKGHSEVVKLLKNYKKPKENDEIESLKKELKDISKIIPEYNKQLEDENKKLKVDYCQLNAVLESRTSQNELLQKQLKEDSMFLTNLYGKITDLSEVLGMIAVFKDLIDKQYYVALENYIYDTYGNIEEKLKDIISELHLLMVHKKK